MCACVCVCVMGMVRISPTTCGRHRGKFMVGNGFTEQLQETLPFSQLSVVVMVGGMQVTIHV